MSATEVAAPPAGPNLQEVKGPAIEPITEQTPGPDGRMIGEHVIIKKEQQQQPKDSELEKVDQPAPIQKYDLKIELKGTDITDKNDNVQIDQFPANKVSMESAEQKAAKGTSKVTEFKLPDIEKDSGKGDDVTERQERVVDIVKQSKLKDAQKNAPSEIGDFAEFPASRPLTETSLRDGTKMSYDTERDRKEMKSEMDRDSSKTPFSVKVERKPLHTAQTRSHSDYYSKTPSTSRFTHLATSLGQFYGFAADPVVRDARFQPQMPRMRRPPKLVRLATVTMSPNYARAGSKPNQCSWKLYQYLPRSPQVGTDIKKPEVEISRGQAEQVDLPWVQNNISRDYMFPPLEQTVVSRFWSYHGRTKPVPRGPSLYYEEPQKPKKVITWEEANDARPPLRIDMEGPGPTHYSPRNRPLNETNSPAWTFGSRCFVEKGGGARTSWEKTWFQNPEVWTSKVDFNSDSVWPTPTHYRHRPGLGPRQRTMVEAPSFTIGTRREMTMNKMGSDKEPSPVDYDKDTADKIVMKNAPSFSHQFRREGTVVWSSKEKVPGPGSYSPKFAYNKPHGPSFTIRSLRREKSHVLGPFSTF